VERSGKISGWAGASGQRFRIAQALRPSNSRIWILHQAAPTAAAQLPAAHHFQPEGLLPPTASSSSPGGMAGGKPISSVPAICCSPTQAGAVPSTAARHQTFPVWVDGGQRALFSRPQPGCSRRGRLEGARAAGDPRCRRARKVLRQLASRSAAIRAALLTAMAGFETQGTKGGGAPKPSWPGPYHQLGAHC